MLTLSHTAIQRDGYQDTPTDQGIVSINLCGPFCAHIIILLLCFLGHDFLIGLIYWVYFFLFMQSTNEFEDLYENRATATGFPTIIEGGYAYDAVWALAFALNRSRTLIDRGDANVTGCMDREGSLVPLHEFDYSNALLGCVIRWSLEQTRFEGVTVSLH